MVVEFSILGDVPHSWALPLVKGKGECYRNLNIYKSQGVVRGGFYLHLLLKTRMELTPTTIHNLLSTFKAYV